MSDYANAVTEPFWERDLPKVAAYFRWNDWAESRGDKGNLAFSMALRDLSEAGLNDQIVAVLADIELLLPPPHTDFMIALIYERGEVRCFSALEEHGASVAYLAEMDARVLPGSGEQPSADSIARDDAQAGPSPNMDGFLAPFER